MVKGIKTREELFNQIGTYITNPDSIASIAKAYDYAFEKHKDQKRSSGEPYFVHVLNVAYELAKLHADPNTISAGLLHDVIEDCDVTKEEFIAEFGEEIYEIVEAVTKISNLKFADEKEYQATNHRKILIAMAKDVRVILVKLVDRLHNMRTLEYLAPEKQKRIARETLDVYAPIAHRLGIAEIKNELEDLSFYYLDNEKYHVVPTIYDNEHIVQISLFLKNIGMNTVRDCYIEIDSKDLKQKFCSRLQEQGCIDKGDEKNIRTEIVLNENISAPLEYLEPVGVQKCYLNDELIGEINLVTKEKVESKKWGNFFTEILDFGYRLGR